MQAMNRMTTSHSEAPDHREDQLEIDRMLLRGDITVEDHRVLDNFVCFLQASRIFSLPSARLEIRTSSGRPDTLNVKVHDWKQLSYVQDKLKAAGDEVNRQVIDLALDTPRQYDLPTIKLGIQVLNGIETWF